MLSWLPGLDGNYILLPSTLHHLPTISYSAQFYNKTSKQYNVFFFSILPKFGSEGHNNCINFNLKNNTCFNVFFIPSLLKDEKVVQTR